MSKILFVLSFLLIAVQGANNFYASLDLTSDATDQDIRKAFRALSIKYHPDKNPNNKEAQQRYLEVNRAHEILTDQESKQIYDLYGEEGLTSQRGQYRNKQRGPNAQADITVTLEELYNGAIKEFKMKKNIICKRCRGSGSKDGTLQQCKHCKGQGVRMQNVNMGIGFTVQMQVPCDRCGGKGKISAGNCPECYGQKTLAISKTLKIDIEKGMTDGQNIVFKGESEQNPDYLPGDLIFTLKQTKHPQFIRQGNDLHLDIRLTLKESILGFKKRIRHLDNHYVDLESNKVIQPFETRLIREEGMPFQQFSSTRGDLIIHFIVDLPKTLTASDTKLLQQIFQ